MEKHGNKKKKTKQNLMSLDTILLWHIYLQEHMCWVRI